MLIQSKYLTILPPMCHISYNVDDIHSSVVTKHNTPAKVVKPLPTDIVAQNNLLATPACCSYRRQLARSIKHLSIDLQLRDYYATLLH